jgi:hypothetical protein
MVGVGMRQGVGGHVVCGELAKDLAAGVARSCIDQDVLDQVRVDRVRQEERVEMPDAVGHLLHAAETISTGPPRRPAGGVWQDAADPPRGECMRWTTSRS